MNTKTRSAVAAVLATAVGLWVLLGAGPAAWGQDAGAEAPPADPAGGLPSVTTQPAVDTSDWWKEISPEEFEKLIQKAEALRLADERQKVIDEIRDGLLFDEQAKDAAEKLLTGDGAKTQEDNIDRILQAFAKVDGRFGKCYGLFTEGKYAECAEAAKQTLSATQTDHHSAAKYYLYAESLLRGAAALSKEGKTTEAEKTAMDAADAFVEIMRLMPERISFASTGAIKSGKAFEDYARWMNAMKVYAFALQNYGLALSAEQREALLGKIEAWEAIYRDPMNHLAKEMGHVETRLKGADSGQQTQQKQREIVMVLEDLIKTIEENQGGQSGQGQQQQREARQCASCGGKGCSACGGTGQQQGRSQGSSQGRPQGTQQPSSPAKESFLPTGSVERPGQLSRVHSSAESGEWSELPPRQRERLQEIMKKTMSERYRNLISDYRASLSDKGAGGR